jgi:hypothetical protein
MLVIAAVFFTLSVGFAVAMFRGKGKKSSTQDWAELLREDVRPSESETALVRRRLAAQGQVLNAA